MMKKISIVFLLFLTACGFLSHPSILKDNSCQLPCWNGVQVGKTNETQFLIIIRNLPSLNNGSIESGDARRGVFDRIIGFTLYGGLPPMLPTVRAEAYLSQGTVTELYLSGNLGVSSKQLTDEIGNPKYVFAGQTNAGGKVDVWLIYPQQGIMFGYAVQDESAEISADTQITELRMIDPKLYTELINNGWLINFYNASNLYPWNGYGRIVDKYWPPVH